MRSFFHRGGKFQPLQLDDDERADVAVPDGLWVKCPGCGELIYSRELEHNLMMCPKCDYHHRLSARQRIELLGRCRFLQEWDADILTGNPLGFAEPSGTYESKIAKTVKRSGETESLVSGRLAIDGQPVAVAVADFSFLGASMGSVFGEKLARAAERALAEDRLPLADDQCLRRRPHARGALLADADGQDDRRAAPAGRGQAAAHLAADRSLLRRRQRQLRDGRPMSILAEPGALIGFAGPRVIEQIIKQKLPEGFQTAEFLLEHGMIDGIVPRPELTQSTRPVSCATTAAPAAR